MQCGGNTYQSCGGPGTLSMYNNTAYYYQDCLANWTTVGCVAEANMTRLLVGKSYTNTSVPVTREVCGAYCQSLGMPYMGLEYGQQCYCGTSLVGYGNTTLPPLLPAATCGMPCKGNSLQYCGGSKALNLYRFDNKTICPIQTPPASTPTASTPTSAPTGTPDSPAASSSATAIGASLGAAALLLGSSGIWMYRRRVARRSLDVESKAYNLAEQGSSIALAAMYTSSDALNRPVGPRDRRT